MPLWQTIRWLLFYPGEWAYPKKEKGLGDIVFPNIMPIFTTKIVAQVDKYVPPWKGGSSKRGVSWLETQWIYELWYDVILYICLWLRVEGIDSYYSNILDIWFLGSCVFWVRSMRLAGYVFSQMEFRKRLDTHLCFRLLVPGLKMRFEEQGACGLERDLNRVYIMP